VARFVFNDINNSMPHRQSTEEYMAKRREWADAYRKRHRPKVLERQKRWYDANKQYGIVKVRHANARAKLLGIPGRLTGEDYDRRMAEQMGHCCYCWKPFDDVRRPSIDHKKSIALGGDNTYENMAIACTGVGGCNQKKNSSHWEPGEFGEPPRVVQSNWEAQIEKQKEGMRKRRIMLQRAVIKAEKLEDDFEFDE
jgi:5-methylcytosine-specific restriction endonuclease McrA